MINLTGYEKRTLDKKSKVKNATFELINSDTGLSGVTMDDISKHANVSKTSLFKYFGDKDQLIHEVYREFLEKMGEEAYLILEKNLPFEETIIAMSQNKINHLRNINKRFYLDMMDYVTEKNDEGLSIMMKEYSMRSVDIMLDLFHKGKKEGKVDLKYSDEFLIIYFQALVEGISSPLIYDRILTYTMEWTELLIKGVAPKK